MNPNASQKIAVLVTGLFSDAATVETAIAQNFETGAYTKVNLQPEKMIAEDWDDVVKLVLSVSKVITV